MVSRLVLSCIALSISFGAVHAQPAGEAGDPGTPVGGPATAASQRASDAGKGPGGVAADASGGGAPSLAGSAGSNAQESKIVKPGMFTIIEDKGHTLFEIPNDLFGRDLFWYAEVVADPPETQGILGNSVGSAVVRFERRNGVVYVRDLTNRSQARAHFRPDGEKPNPVPSSSEKLKPLDLAIENADMPPVMISSPILGNGPNGGVVIDVTGIFTSDLDEFSVAKALWSDPGDPLLVGKVDPDRSYIEEAQSFPRNVRVNGLLTFEPPSDIARLARSDVPPADKSLSVLIGYSITLLPEPPMRSRLFDERVGYFTSSFTNYETTARVPPEKQSIILRRRLEKKDPGQEVSEPVEPIVFYVGRDVPDQWRPYIKRGIEDWQPAFEAAGFKNAILAKDAPGPDEDPGWDEADARWSVVRWVTEPLENALGPNIHDPRSGEILSAHVLVWAKILDLAEETYFTQAGGADKRAAKLPLPEEILGGYLRAVVAHEVGHTLGLTHNFKASQAYTVEQLRDPDFADKHGPVASIMSYGRVNYVAQPGDGVTNFLPGIGPYDRFAIAWGYKPIPDADTPADEVPTLDKWANAQLDNPWLAFGGEDFAAEFDPTVLTEAIGKDRIESTTLGLQNIDRVAARLGESARDQRGTGRDIDKMYHALVDTRTSWIEDIAKMVGGMIEYRAAAIAKGTPRYEPVSRDDQQRAVDFILKTGLASPEKFLDPRLLSLFLVADATGPIEESEAGILNSLLSGRVYVMLHQQAVLDPDAYTVTDLLEDVTGSVWAELRTPGTPIAPLRRSLQRAYLDRLTSQLSMQGKPVDTADLEAEDIPPAAARILLSNGEGTDFNSAVGVVMQELADRIEASKEWSKDPATTAHLVASLVAVKAIMDLAR